MSSSGGAGVIAAPMRLEAAAVRAGLRRAGLPALSPRVLQTGAGAVPRRAAALAGVPAVAVAGVCGALVDGLAAGDVVVPAVVLGPAGESYACPAAALLSAELRAAGLRVHEGPLISAPALVHGRAERARLATTGAVAVDLETAPLLAACDPGALTAVVRVVVDSPAHPLLRAGTASRGVLALRVLRAAAPVIARFLAAAGDRTVLLAEPRSFCAGVERAISTVERVLEQRSQQQSPEPVYVRRQIVHNTHVVNDLQQRGAVFVRELDEVPAGATVVLSAHGVAPAVRQQAADLQLRIVDATCPLVAKVHTEARRAAEHGDTVVLIGHRDHEEVEGTVGEAPGRTLVVDTPEAVAELEVPAGAEISYLMQTTLAVDEAAAVAAAIRARFPAAKGPASEDICYATSNRQAAVRAVAECSDVVLVVGSANSSNSLRLVEVAQRCGAAAHLVEDVSAVRLEWLASARTVGITAGASAPPSLVDEIVHALRGLGPITVSPITVGRENVAFELPREVRP